MGRQANATVGKGSFVSSCATCGKHVVLAECRLASCAQGLAPAPGSKNTRSESRMVVEFPSCVLHLRAWCRTHPVHLEKKETKQKRGQTAATPYLHRCKKDDNPQHASPCLPIHRPGYANKVGGVHRRSSYLRLLAVVARLIRLLCRLFWSWSCVGTRGAKTR